MDIKLSIKLPIEKKKDKVICYDGRVVQMVLGTAAASGNLHNYGVEKKSNPVRWEVPIDTIKRRINEIERRIEKEQQYLEIMKQVVK